MRAPLFTPCFWWGPCCLSIRFFVLFCFVCLSLVPSVLNVEGVVGLSILDWPFGFLFTFICPMSCVPNFAIVHSRLTLRFSLDYPFLISLSVSSSRLFVLYIVYPMLEGVFGLSILDWPFSFLWTVHSWFPCWFTLNVYLSYVLCTQCCHVFGLSFLDWPFGFL